MQTYITREQDYALRITSALAALNKNDQLPVSELSKRLYISKNFAARIVHKLAKNGILSTTQGKYGGVSLKKQADKLSVYEVLETIGFKTKLNQCLDERFPCEFSNKCLFHLFFDEEEKKLHEKMKQKMISEFVI
ncbi:MAG: Rrf2 family transcriptional regulator [Melioribacteraceae bacterium]|nr:Rrf2 family transcriptional regulator [Melioribacteraceae bacterium]WKZ69428.1 MAG: Rrf2 family transcriptional regulator [Melioribacteraceae bacterium]